MDASITLHISHRGTLHTLSLPPDSTWHSLQTHLEELTRVPPSNQKFLGKGLKKRISPDDTLGAAGVKDGVKIQMLGPTPEELGGMKAAEDEKARRDRIMRERALKQPVAVRNTGSSSSASLNYRFHAIAPLPHLPRPDAARALLQRLADDPAIRHIMQRHQFAVGLLTELAPHEHPNLLGLNVNAGQEIKLRIRTDRYDGFRLYADIRRVLCHELTHNVHGDHDNDFKELNSQLNREVTQFESARAGGAHRLGGAGDLLRRSQAYVLGGKTGSVTPLPNESPSKGGEDAAGTVSRLRKEEEELERSCGTTGSS
ncbi:WLM domain-containing protein [Schizophyllum amplum]|uniref:WLM domain-containing protein n=1 Tax=Schizophyllum amplum TaxID=97359 RepID=A0A550C1P7_9AGAR|nr:WLM domain-containing protein [Auriculariopsis ampla]